ncbi:DUF1294 domain-containing protein [uncultured Dialister sp.]|jgi:uncharacterized membrane protein YsdA (DUF1294 family)|uniref:DUF1294 domain-containing protein n=1 Tax=uncultured Dialister sp. TaxID=278064 RepID=UPI0025E1D2A1|nr:DUF1294 domain-containing protein [uncultured Dialister sp.]
MREYFLYFLAVNLLAFCLFGLDKWKAIHGRWRISEKTLLLSALSGGFLGAFLGMHYFHHKTRHKKFVYGVPAIGTLEIAASLFAILAG